MKDGNGIGSNSCIIIDDLIFKDPSRPEDNGNSVYRAPYKSFPFLLNATMLAASGLANRLILFL